jgi:hypothetical protein
MPRQESVSTGVGTISRLFKNAHLQRCRRPLLVAAYCYTSSFQAALQLVIARLSKENLLDLLRSFTYHHS